MIAIENEHFFSKSHVTKVRTASLQAEFALVFTHAGEMTLATRHLINNNTLQAGKPVNPEQILEDIVMDNKRMQQVEKDTPNAITFLPQNLLIENAQHIVWYQKSQSRPMWFCVGRTLQLRVNWPAVLFIVNKRSRTMLTFALASNQRPRPSTRLYRAPFMNISGSGAFCLGSATLPEVINSDNLDQMETCLYDSNFTHINDQSLTHPCFSTNEKHLKMWRKLAKTNKKIKVTDLPYIGRLASILV